MAGEVRDRAGGGGPVVFIGLGANLGDALANLEFGLRGLEGLEGFTLEAVSSPYRTAPVGGVEQPDFWNAVARGRYTGGAGELLAGLLAIEKACGRERNLRWGPRTLDLDLLLFGDELIRRPELVVPHPEMAGRVFVLAPLMELDPELVIPGLGQTPGQLLAAMDPAQRQAQTAQRGQWPGR